MKKIKDSSKIFFQVFLIFSLTISNFSVMVPEVDAVVPDGWMDASQCVAAECGTSEGTKTQDFYEQVCDYSCPIIEFEASHQVVDVAAHWGDCPAGYEVKPGHQNKCIKKEVRREFVIDTVNRSWIDTTYKTETFGPINVVYGEKSEDPNHCHRPTAAALSIPSWAMGDYNTELNELEDFIASNCRHEVTDTRTISCSDAPIIPCPAVCGNEIPEEGEQCDDGNLANGDGCSETCQVEQSSGPVCGDGVIDEPEQCDDGNSSDGDGCTANCALEQLTCDDLDGDGWYARYYNYSSEHPDMNLPSGQWPDATHGDPLGSWDTDWYNQEYLKFSRVDSSLTFGGNFFPFDFALEENNYNGHDFHFGAQWTGLVSVPTEGDYEYTLTSDDDAWVYLDGVLAVDNSGIHAPVTKTGTLHLTGVNIVEIFFAERHTTQSHFSFNFTGEGVTVKPYSEDCPECGNYIVEGREECDAGPNGSLSCSPDCQLPPVCDPEIELIINGSFENPTVTNAAKWDIFPGELTSWITDWVSFDSYPGQTRPATATLELHKSGLFSGIIPDGFQYAELDGDWAGPNGAGNGEPASVKISQELKTWPGYQYQISFNFSPRPNENSANNVLKFSWDGVLQDTITRSGISGLDWSNHSYNLAAAGYKTLIEFADNGISNSLGTFIDNISVRCIPTPTPEPEVKICKQDIEQNYLPGWQVALASNESVAGPTLINVSDGNGTDSPVLPAGYYLIKVSGTYRYGSSAMIADAGYSYRPIGIPSGCDCWLSGFDLPSGSNGLMAWINGNPVYWGPENNDHTYTIIYQHLSDGPVNLAIWDNVYSDNLNNGNFQFEVFPIDFQGTTGDDGCVTFEDVPYGGYLLEEENRQNWQNVSGLGGIEVDEEEETFIIVNEDLTEEPKGSICGYKWHDRNENSQRDEEPGLSGWTINLVQFIGCETGDEWADDWSDYIPGKRKDGTDIEAARTNPTESLGAAEGDDTINFVSLGFGGSIVLEFDNYIINGAGDDVQVVETSYGSPICSNYPEMVKIYASQDKINWTEIGSGCLDVTYDLGDLPWAKYLKLVDISDKFSPKFPGSADGFDIDGVKALHCASEMTIIDYRITNKSGDYCFEDLTPGNYRVQEAMQFGWYNITPLFADVVLEEGNSLSVNFGNNYEGETEPGSICGYKFNDENRDGIFNEGENGLSNWTIWATNYEVTTNTLTNEIGRYCFNALTPGTWNIWEEMIAGWFNTTNTTTSVVLIEGQSVDNVNFGNYQTFCGDGIKQEPNGVGVGGPEDDGYESCDGQDGVTEGYICTQECLLEAVGPECNTSADCSEGEICVNNECVYETCNPDPNVDWAIYSNGRYWAWASPCDGGCSQAYPDRVAGWRYATEAEWELRPAQSEFMVNDQFICAAAWFDDTWSHCDYGNPEVRTPQGGWYELWLIYDCNGLPTYSWSESEWGACTVSCGGGTQSREVVCLESAGGVDTVVDDQFCLEIEPKPATQQECNTEVCNLGGGGSGGSGGGGGGGNPYSLIIHTEAIGPEGEETISATITWHTNRPATSRVIYDTVSHPILGIAPNYGYQWSTPTTDLDPKVTFHTVIITGLDPETVYYFRPISAASPEVVGVELSYQTSTAEEPTGGEEENLPGPEEQAEEGVSGTGSGPSAGGNAGGTGESSGGVVAGVEFEEKLAQADNGQAGEEPAGGEVLGSGEEQQEENQASKETNCIAYIWVLLLLNLASIAILWQKGKNSSNKTAKNFWWMILIAVILPLVIGYPACWVPIWLVVTLIVSVALLAGFKKNTQAETK